VRSYSVFACRKSDGFTCYKINIEIFTALYLRVFRLVQSIFWHRWILESPSKDDEEDNEVVEEMLENELDDSDLELILPTPLLLFVVVLPRGWRLWRR